MKDLKESCGVVGAVSKSGKVIDNIWLALLALQHRGQESSGVFTFDGNTFHQRKELGLVSALENFSALAGSIGIGHVRYSTVGRPADKDTSNNLVAIDNFAQPFFVDFQKKGMALCHNGNLVNIIDLSKTLLSNGIFLSSRCDGEVILKTMVHELMQTRDIETSVKNCMAKLEGAYSVTAVTGEGEVIAFRDPNGFRPLCFGESESLTMVGSESVALNVNGIDKIGDLNPGEMMVITEDGKNWTKQIAPCERKAHCMFEYVYFSRPDSVLNGKDVYSVRINLGKNLAETYEIDADVIVPVPDTARPAAEGISRETGVHVAEGLIKNRYIGRTFIMPEQRTRDDSVNVKLNPVRSVLEDKKVVLVDDSIVRGTTSRKIVSLLKRAGAREVNVWITCPPIISPCFYGIDIATHSELIAANQKIPGIAKTIGADRLCYQTLPGLVDAIGFEPEELCLACLTGSYPTPLAQKIADEMKGKRLNERVRYWEMNS